MGEELRANNHDELLTPLKNILNHTRCSRNILVFNFGLLAFKQVVLFLRTTILLK
jgi:hypothetical protein